MATELSVSKMVQKISKLRGTKQSETRDYMIKVAFGRLLALETWRKDNPSKKSKRKVKGSSKRTIRKSTKPKARKAKVVKIGTSGNGRASESKVPAVAAVSA